MTRVPSPRFGNRGVVALADEDELILGLVRPHFNDSGEWVLILSFGHDGRLLSVSENGQRGASDAALTPAMIRTAIAPGAGSHMLLAHNHRSGDLKPSADDISVTHQLALLCRMAGMVLADHLILARSGHFSFRAAGLI